MPKETLDLFLHFRA